MSKKVKDELDDFELDNELDEFDFDFPDPNKPDDRKPLTKFTSGLKEGAVSSLTNPDTIKKALKDTLPKGYGQVIDEADRAGIALRNLYDESAKQVGPVLKQSKRLATKLIPADSKLIPKGLQEALKRWKEEDSQKSSGYSEQDARESAIAASIADIFGAQAQAQQQQFVQAQAKQELRDGVDGIRHRDQITLLNSIAMAVNRQQNYTKNVTHRYYQRSLELQYRNIFALQDLTKTLTEESTKQREILAAIVKNTGLPDAIKATNEETRREIAKRSLYQSVANGMFGERNQTIEGIVKTVSSKLETGIKEAANNFMLGLSAIEMGVDSAEMGGDKTVMAGNVAGGLATDWGVGKLARMAGRKLSGSKLSKKYGIDSYGKKLEGLVSNLPRRVEEFRTDQSTMWDDTFTGRLKGMLQGLLPNNGIQTDVSYAGRKDLQSPYYITRRTDRSLNEVIPGYLARIWREIKVLRTGDESSPLVLFDYAGGGFTKEPRLLRRIKNDVIPKSNVERSQQNLDAILADIDPEGKLSPQAREALKRRLLLNSADNKMGSRERLADISRYETNDEASAEAASAMAAFFDSADQDKINAFTAKHNRLSGDIADTRGIVQEYIDSGNLQQLRALGLVERGSNKIDLRKVLNYYLGKEGGIPPGMGDASPAAPPGGNTPPGMGPEFVGPKPSFGIVVRNAAETTKEKFADTATAVRDLINGKIQHERDFVGPHRPASDYVTEAYQAGKTKANEVVDALTQKHRDKITAAVEKKNYAVALFKGAVSSDVFVAGETMPRLTAAMAAAGAYRLKYSGKLVTKLDDIKEDVIDTKGNLVLRATEISDAYIIDPGTRKALQLSASAAISSAAAKAEKINNEILNPQVGKIDRNIRKAIENGRLKLTDATGKMVDKAMGQVDIYVRGETTPRITAIELKQGKIVDVEGNPVTDVKDIKSDLRNEKGEVVLRLEETEDIGFIDRYTAKWSPLWIAGKLIKNLWHYQTNIAPGMALRNLGRVWKLYSSVGKQGLRAAKWMLGMRVNNFPQDCYLKGEIHPVLFGSVMKAGGYFSASSPNKRIDNPAQIDGAVVDANGQYVLTEEQYKAGLYNLEGRKISTTIAGRLIKSVIGFPFKVAGKIAGTAAKGAWGAVKGAADGVGAVGRAGLSAMGAGARGLGYLMGIRYEGDEDERKDLIKRRKEAAGGIFNRSTDSGSGKPASAETDETKADRKFKNMDLSQAAHLASGRFGRLRASLGLNRNDALSLQSAGMLGSILELLKKQDADKEAEITGVPSKYRRAKSLLARAKSFFGKKKEGEEKQEGKKEDDDGASLSDIKAGWDLLKDGVKGGKKGLGKLGGLAAKYGGKLLGLTGLISGGAAAASALGGGTAAAGAATAAATTAAAGAAATGGVMTSLAGAAAAAGTAAAAFLSSPIVIGAAAAGLTAYAGYKAYKYFTRGSLSELGKIRLVQYGFKADDQSWAKRMVDLEQLVLEHTSLDKDGKVAIDSKKLQFKKMISAVGLDYTNKYHHDVFVDWFLRRFRPVYATHLTAAQAIAGSMDFNSPESLKGEKRKQFIDAVAFPDGPYAYAVLPVWPRGSLVATNAQDVAEAVAQARKDVASASKSIVQKVVEATVPAANAAVNTQKSAPRPNDVVDEKKPTTAAQASLSMSAQIGVNALSNGARVDALEAVRFKTYGLLELDPDKTQALRTLERLVANRISVGGRDSRATWSDDVTTLLGKVATNFGITDERGTAGSNWRIWFATRFLPVYLNYQTAVFAKTGKVATAGADGQLRPADQLEIAKLIAATKDIWSVTNSPWPGYVVSVNSEYIGPNFAYLESVAGKVLLEEQRREKATKESPAQAPANVNAGTAKAADRWKTLIKQAGDKAAAPDAETPVPSSASFPGSTTVSTPATAGGELADGRNASGYLALQNGVKLDGLNDQFKQQLLGAIEEYGIKTGKTVNLNDAFRSYADQVARKKKYGARAAEPGNSLHEFGLAVDIDATTLNAMDKLGILRKYGLVRPVGQEPWHLEPIGIQDNLSLYKNDPQSASQAVKNGIGRGGGGWGTVASAARYSRNAEMSRAIASAGSGAVVDDNNGYTGTIAALAPRDQGIVRKNGAEGPVPLIPKMIPVEGGRKPSVTEVAKANVERQRTGGAFTPAGKTLIASNDSEFNPAGGSSSVDPTFRVPAPTGQGIDGMRDTIVGAAKMVGVDPDILLQHIAMESDFKSNAAASSSNAAGIAQFTDRTWRETVGKYGGKYGYDSSTDRNDVKASAIMAAHLLKDNLSKLRSNGKVGALEAYMAHFLGVSGANRFFSEMQRNPNAIAAAIMPVAAKNNQGIFYTQEGRARTLSEVYNELSDRIRKKAKAYGLNDPQFAVVAQATQPNAQDASGGRVAAPISDAVMMRQPPRVASPAQAIRPPVTMPVPVRDQAVAPRENTNYSSTLLQNAATATIEALAVQRQILEVVKAIADKPKSTDPAPAMPEPIKEDEPRQVEESYSVPKVPVPMRRFK